MAAIDFDVRTHEEHDRRTGPIASTALAVALIAGALIALESLRPVHSIDAAGRAAIETATAAVGLITARLLIGVFDRGRQLRELLLVLAVLAVSAADLLYWADPLVAGGSSGAYGAAARLACELIGAFAFAGAAFVPARVIVPPPSSRARTATWLGIGVVAAAVLLGDTLVAHAMPRASNGTGATGAVRSIAMGIDLLSAGTLAVASLAFVARSSRMERGTGLLAGACLLLAAAAVQFVAVPIVPAAWITPRDGARCLAFALLLGGALLRYSSVQRRVAYSAIRSERERMARDLHDGLAQDLACITTQAQRLDCQLGPQHPLMLATRDALVELRGVIADLTASTAATSEEAVWLVARDQARRLDLDVEVRADSRGAAGLDDERGLEPHDDLIRATREAITNAAVNGGARQVDVAMSHRAGHVVVRVSGSGATVPGGPPRGPAARARRARGASRLSSGWSRRVRRRRSS